MTERPRYLSVAQVADLFGGLSEMTLYRAINAGQFPAIRIRRRLFVPAEAIEDMTRQALQNGAVVNAADWVNTSAA